MYTIKCLAVNFEMSKSHKRVIKKFNKFVMFGKKAGLSDDADAGVEIEKVFREDDKPHEDVDQERGREIEEKVLGKNLNFQCDDINKNCDENDEARHGNVEAVDSTSEKTEKLPSSHTKINKFHLKPGKNGKVHIPCVEKPHRPPLFISQAWDQIRKSPRRRRQKHCGWNESGRNWRRRAWIAK